MEVIKILYCKECGHKIQKGDSVCTNCGTPIDKDATNGSTNYKPYTPSKKAPKTLKQKIIYSTVGIIIIAIISAISWGNTYYSAEKVQQRFIGALQKKNVEKIQNIVTHEDGSDISKVEAKALLRFTKEYGIYTVKDMLSIKKDGSILGIIKKNVITFPAYFAQFDDAPKGLSFTFDKKSLARTRVDETTTQFGPLIPGIYHVNAILNNNFGKSSKRFNITLKDSNVLMDEVSFFKDSLEINGYSSNTMHNAKILANGKEINIDSDGYTDTIGPVITGSKLDLQFSATMPWGERTSDLQLEDGSNVVYPSVTNESDNKAIEKTITTFYDEAMEYAANQNSSVLKITTEKFKSAFMDELSYYDTETFSGRIDKVLFNTKQISFNAEEKNSIDIYTELQGKYGYSEDSSNTIDAQDNYYLVTLTYNAEKKKWEISGLTEADSMDMNDSITVKGDTHSRVSSINVGNLKDASSGELKTAFEPILSNLYSTYTDAVNAGDFDLVSDLIVSNSPSYKETKKTIDNYYEKGIVEQFRSVKVNDVNRNGNTMTVTSEDEYLINHPEKGDRIQKFNTKSIFKYTDGSWKLYKLISTDLISSEDY